jgi:hypothetical protein
MSVDAYTNEELSRLSDDVPIRGVFCPKCGQHIPTFAALTQKEEARLRALDIISAIREVRSKTGCGLAMAKIWALHPNGPHPKKDGPPCPYCSRPLFTSKTKQCLHCGWDWHDAKHPVQHPVKPEPNQSLQPTAPSGRG